MGDCMTVIINGTTGIDTVQDGIITNAKIASMAATKLTGQVPDANAPSGSVLQVVRGSVLTGAVNTTSSTLSEVSSSYRTSITPISSTSRILVQFFGHFMCTASSAMKIELRVSTDGGSSFSSIQSGNGEETFRNASSGTLWTTSTLTVLHSPNTTSACIYSIFFASWIGSQTVRINDNPMGSNFILTEIAG